MEIHNLINGYVEMEKAVASIYGTFMHMFPGEKDFWKDLLDDEMDHSSFLKNADYLGIVNELQSIDLFPSIQLVEKSFNFVESTYKHIQLNPVSLKDALKIALELENTMVETFANDAILKFLAADDEYLTEKILASERAHADKIKEMMIKKGYMKLS